MRPLITQPFIAAIIACILLPSIVQADDSLTVLPKTINGIEPRDMVQQYLRGKVAASFEQWRKDYEGRTTPEQIADYQKQMRAKFRAALGQFPQRTPLNAKVVGTIQRDGFTIEKILFESQPNHYVTAALYLPDAKRFKPPYPAVLFPCGHTKSAKAGDAYQRAPSLLALHGMAALCFDPIGQGERMQLLDSKGVPRHWGTREHTMLGIGAKMLGRNTATYEVWDGMRCLDYLETRKDIDASRFGCMGVSGGGTQTSYLMVLDERIKVASPACYITSFEQLITDLGPQDAEQNIAGQLAFGMDHADYLMLRAPMPTLVAAATHDFFPIEGTWRSYRYAKRLYTRMDQGEKLAIVENDAKHNYNQQLREASVHWMQRWLLGVDKPVKEPDMKLLPERELWCTPRGQSMLIDGARSVYDLNIDAAKAAHEDRTHRWLIGKYPDTLPDLVRRIAKIRPLNELKAEVNTLATMKRDTTTITKLTFQPEPGITLPALLFKPNKASDSPPMLYLHSEGFAKHAGQDGAIQKLVNQGRVVLAVDLRNMGETRPRSSFKDAFTAYLLAKPFVGMRTEDTLVAAQWLSKQHDNKPIHLIAQGDAAIPALHAAALEKQLFGKTQFDDALESWTSLIENKWIDGHLLNAVHFSLQVYDLPDLRQLMKGTRVR